MRYLIKNGLIVDGTGRLPFEADLLIDEDKIVDIGNLRETGDFQVVNGEGMMVAPGFIDVNNHSDTYWTLFEYPIQESLITQGITTVIGGNCGTSLAPLIGTEAIKSLRKYSDISKVQVDWASFGEFVNFLKQRSFNPNFGSLVGHSTLRRGILGDDVRQLREDEVRVLAATLDSALSEGALGFSTGLVYSHSRIASGSEIIRLAEVVQEHNGVYATHIRHEGEDLISSIKEAVAVAEATQVKLQISHLKACGPRSWPLQDQVLDIIREEKRRGINVNFDVYPYTIAGPVLYTLLPGWVTEGGKEALINRLKDSVIRAKVVEEMEASEFDYGDVIIATSKIGSTLLRRKVADIAENQGRTPEEVIIDLLLASDDTITTIVELMSGKNVEKAIIAPESMICSDGVGYSSSAHVKGDLVHPRCFGAFPRFLARYIFQNKVLTIAGAIEKITRIPAEKYGLIKERGTLEKGKKADVVVFDASKLIDKATVENPFAYSEGVKDLFINGVPVIKDGDITGERAGKVITK